MMTGAGDTGIDGLLALYRNRETRPSEVIRECLDGIASKDGAVGAFLHVCEEEALARAAELDAHEGELPPLFGVPVAVKDNICTRGVPTTCASRILRGYHPPYDATVVSKLEEAGAVIVGKTNMDEFAMGSSTENSAFGITRNPWDESRCPGGSSGGSAAAVASGMVPVALGSDTGGSIRQPAAFCGVVGLKGTYGRVSRYGLVAFASSFDQIGPLAGNVRDAARVMEVIAGRDPLDATSVEGDCEGMTGGLERGLGGLSFAVPEGMERWRIDSEVREIFSSSMARLGEAGVTLQEAGLPDVDLSISCYYVIASAEASSNLARYDGVRYGLRASSEDIDAMYMETRGEGFGDEVKRRILTGTYVLSSGYYDAYYRKAQEVRGKIRARFRKLFGEFDIIALPTTPEPAFGLGERTEDPVSMYMSDIFTTPSNVAGLPAISIPAGLTSSGLPVGLQLMAGAGREGDLLRAADAMEKLLRFQDLVPGHRGMRGREQ